MNKQKENGIGWCDYTWSPVTGCLNNCFYCYAQKIGMRFNGHFKPTFHPERLEQPCKEKKPSKIFVCSMADLFGDWILSDVIKKVIQVARDNPRHIFQFLTKNPERYSDFNFPNNCWLGITIDKLNAPNYVKWENFIVRNIYRNKRNQPNLKFISFEPLLFLDIGYLKYLMAVHNPDWVIIGTITGAGNKKYQLKLEWIKDIVRQMRGYDTPVFMKRSLQGIWKGELLREFPATKGAG